jgi:hypothetical protein
LVLCNIENFAFLHIFALILNRLSISFFFIGCGERAWLAELKAGHKQLVGYGLKYDNGSEVSGSPKLK